ncbi:MAG: radical SAM family heme chaperone HemW [Gammaproteobacteria bacterium]|nr:radical SAM family heme chaperone HemW [Gammaproteobacteria bacterium]
MPSPDRLPLALYVHFPWCLRKCPYCDFNSHALRAPLDEAAYLRALRADLAQDLAIAAGRRVASVFFGGGTPSLASPGFVGGLLETVDRLAGVAPDAEITLEANPGAADAGRFAGYRAAGVNRLSIGVQSFDDRALAALGRVHDGREALAAAAAARTAGFDNLNLDLMYALPGQDVRGALADLDRALALAPEHLSWYQLTIEPNTAFAAAPPSLPDEDGAAEIQDAGLARLAEAGLARYEVSAFARAGRRCRHNLNYWEFGDYLGVGAGAHGKLSLPDGGVLRRRKPRHPGAYLAGAGTAAGIAGEHRLAPDDLEIEFAMNALRLVDGVPTALFGERTGLDPGRLAAPAARARALGLLAPDPSRLAASPRGLQFLNRLIALFAGD